MNNHYHTHLTINNSSNQSIIPKGFKQTTIILEHGNIQQQDIMITKHYAIGYKNINSVDDIKKDIQETIKRYNLDVIRIKIEKDITNIKNDVEYPITNNNYLEIHCKISNKNLNHYDILLENKFVRSKNPNSKQENEIYYFWNKRMYSSSDIFSNIDYVKKFFDTIEYKELKIEQIILDTNHNIDSWWA